MENACCWNGDNKGPRLCWDTCRFTSVYWGIYFVRLFQGLGQTGVLIRNLGATDFCFQLWLVYVLHTSVKLCNLTFPHLSQWYFIAGTLVARYSLQRWQMTYFCFLSVILHTPTHSDCGVSTWGGGGGREEG